MTAATSLSTTTTTTTATATQQVDGWLREARPKLPIQNPLWAFVHNNILLEFEHLPFADAVREAAALYRANPYERESFYRAELQRGRLQRSALHAVLQEQLVQSNDGNDVVERFLADTSIGDTRPPRALVPGPAADHLVRYSVRDRPLFDFLVPLVSSFLDQRMAGWTNPYLERGFWAWFEASVLDVPSFNMVWQAELVQRVRGHAGKAIDQIVVDELAAFVPAGREGEYVVQTLFILKGWSGMVSKLEGEPELAPVAAPRLPLKEWLAAMLVSIHALELYLQRVGLDPPNPEPFAWPTVGLGRLALWHEAYERSFAGALLTRVEAAAAEVVKEQTSPRMSSSLAPAVYARRERQAVVCMDDRIESFRRALERPEIDVETVGSVGFFGVDMRYRAIGANQPTRQCPPVVTPSRTVDEKPVDEAGRAVSQMQRLGHSASLMMFYQSRSLLRGFVVSLGLGLTSFVPLVVQTLIPGKLARFRQWFRRLAFPQPRSTIAIDAEGGYDIGAQADIVWRTLKTAGLRGEEAAPGTPLAKTVAVVGHQSTTTNNPFRQAYGCGACSGNSGRPNARAFVQMANRTEVRAALKARGFVIGDDTLFVAVLHDTTAETVDVVDRETLPVERRADIDDLERRLKEAARLNGVERARRFVNAPTGLREASAHMLERANDLAQPRPELGHNRVAACIVGRRRLTQKLNLDRRAFLVSYDPTTDVDGSVLVAAVMGSVPVAVNIGMDYYFSRVDPDGFGAGSKLPLNVVSLLGVITGSKSDLRIGLARQMVELHEPMRMVVLIECTREHLTSLVENQPRLRRLCYGAWMRLVRIDPDTGALECWSNGDSVPWRDAWPEWRDVSSSSSLSSSLTPIAAQPAAVVDQAALTSLLFSPSFDRVAGVAR